MKGNGQTDVTLPICVTGFRSTPAKWFVQTPLKSMDFCAGGGVLHWFASLGSHITGSLGWILSIKQLVLSEWQMQK